MQTKLDFFINSSHKFISDSEIKKGELYEFTKPCIRINDEVSYEILPSGNKYSPEFWVDRISFEVENGVVLLTGKTFNRMVKYEELKIPKIWDYPLIILNLPFYNWYVHDSFKINKETMKNISKYLTFTKVYDDVDKLVINDLSTILSEKWGRFDKSKFIKKEGKTYIKLHDLVYVEILGSSKDFNEDGVQFFSNENIVQITLEKFNSNVKDKKYLIEGNDLFTNTYLRMDYHAYCSMVKDESHMIIKHLAEKSQ